MSERVQVVQELLNEADKLAQEAGRLTEKARALRVAVDVIRERHGAAVAASGDLKAATMIEAVEVVLREAGEPLHTDEIHGRVIARGRAVEKPALRGVLYGSKGKKLFENLGKGTFRLRQLEKKTAE
ncbi:hypothetical protein FJY63_02800 [Candidatus Sumerlaeota bacterium]|nr:hypothetical protein [Candidatus Sumerlaeota bacterium]